MSKTLWTTVNVNFGGQPETESKHWSEKLVYFTSMIAGLIMWSSFTAAMTTNLSVRISKKPFDSIETFLESDYEYTILEQYSLLFK